MSRHVFEKYAREAVQEWLASHHNQFAKLVEIAATAAAPEIAWDISRQLQAMIEQQDSGKTEERLRAALERARIELLHLVQHEVWTGKDRLAFIADGITSALEGSEVQP